VQPPSTDIPPLNPDFSDMLSALNEAGVEYPLVGAYAVSLHAVARFTYDIDSWIRATESSGRRAIDALRSFGAPLHDITPDAFTSPGLIFQIGVQSNCIHLTTSVSGTDFDGCWAPVWK